jgi:FKBP-type peptidyl-prolyl cis-trans isomerase
MASSALETGKAFLEDNAKKPGVISTASGLQYVVLTEGTGKSPTAKDTVVVNYRGTLINGVEFDSSYLAGREPAEFPLKRVIKGWTEGLQLMKEGGRYRFFIPSNLAYGKRGSGLDIRPDETLIFEVELLKVWED